MKKIKVYVNIYQQGGKVGVSLFPFSSYAKARKELKQLVFLGTRKSFGGYGRKRNY